jgi:hypothetical protein
VSNLQHPDITKVERTGYLYGDQEEEHAPYCCECGKLLRYEEEEVYEDNRNSVLCEDCLKMLHRKYW